MYFRLQNKLTFYIFALLKKTLILLAIKRYIMKIFRDNEQNCLLIAVSHFEFYVWEIMQ